MLSKKSLKHCKYYAHKVKKMPLKFKYSKPHAYYMNIYNIIKYGPFAPRYEEIIWVDPRAVTRGFSDNTLKKVFQVSSRNQFSGKVIEFCWPSEQAYEISKAPNNCFENDGIWIKLNSCIEHWVNGLSWEETGIYKYIEARRKMRGKNNQLDHIVRRYKNLDRIFEQVKSEGRLRVTAEIERDNYLKGSEAIIHVGPGGEPFWGGGSCHRFAIAYILTLPFPAQIGLVHASAIKYLNVFRKENRHRLKAEQ